MRDRPLNVALRPELEGFGDRDDPGVIDHIIIAPVIAHAKGDIIMGVGQPGLIVGVIGVIQIMEGLMPGAHIGAEFVGEGIAGAAGDIGGRAGFALKFRAVERAHINGNVRDGA